MKVFWGQMEYEFQELMVTCILPNLAFPSVGTDKTASGAEYLVKKAYEAWPLYGYIEQYL